MRKKTKKKIKVTLDDVLNAVNSGFTNMEERMATKEELYAMRDELKEDLRKTEGKLVAKIDTVQSSAV